ncbi:MAG: GWxTD domain-containing protein [Acidobacteriota bacterium]
MKKRIIISFLIVFLTQIALVSKQNSFSLSYKEKRKIYKQLPKRHRRWLDMVNYISTKEERDVFYHLTNERDRDLFVKSFWTQRDPSPGTPDNEYRTEMADRFRYVSREFKKGSSKPGWMTDMGKFYMILGKPSSIDRYDSKPGLYPAQVWYYYGDKRLRLPTFFNVMFYKPHNTTEWKLYNPAQQGPQELLIQWDPVDSSGDSSQYVQKIRELAAGLAEPSISMIPNDSDAGLAGSLRSNIILSNIYDSPKRHINASYATNFLDYKGFVDVDSSVNFIDNANKVILQRYKRFGFNFLNISIKPKTISLGYVEKSEQYFYNFKMTVNLKKGEEFIYQYTKNFDFYVPYKDVLSVKKGIVLHDSFPIAPGEYKLLVYVQNTVGKQFSYFDKEIKVPEFGTEPFMTKTIIGYKSEPQAPNFFFPYNINGSKLYFTTENTFKLKSNPIFYVGAYNVSREMWEKGYAEILVTGLNERKKFKQTRIIKLNSLPYTPNMNITGNVADKGLYSDYYIFSIKLYDHNKSLVDSNADRFTIAPVVTMNYPNDTFKKSRLENTYYFNYILGIQYENLNMINRSLGEFEKCISNKPDYIEGHIRYLRLLNKSKNYTKALVKVEKIKDSEKYKFDYHFIKGSSYYGMKDYESALTELLAANKIYDSDLRVLNLLGFTLFNLKEYNEALKTFNASLGLDNNQPMVKRVVKEIGSRLKKK